MHAVNGDGRPDYPYTLIQDMEEGPQLGDLLLKVGDHLDDRSFGCAYRVCKNWKNVLSLHPKWKEIRTIQSLFRNQWNKTKFRHDLFNDISSAVFINEKLPNIELTHNPSPQFLPLTMAPYDLDCFHNMTEAEDYIYGAKGNEIHQWKRDNFPSISSVLFKSKTDINLFQFHDKTYYLVTDNKIQALESGKILWSYEISILKSSMLSMKINNFIGGLLVNNDNSGEKGILYLWDSKKKTAPEKEIHARKFVLTKNKAAVLNQELTVHTLRSDKTFSKPFSILSPHWMFPSRDEECISILDYNGHLRTISLIDGKVISKMRLLEYRKIFHSPNSVSCLYGIVCYVRHSEIFLVDPIKCLVRKETLGLINNLSWYSSIRAVDGKLAAKLEHSEYYHQITPSDKRTITTVVKDLFKKG